MRRLLGDPTQLTILGNGTQSKSYVHVFDVLDAVFSAEAAGDEPFFRFQRGYRRLHHGHRNCAGGHRRCWPQPGRRHAALHRGDRGWKGDVPVVRVNTDRIRALGWNNRMLSGSALTLAMESMLVDFQANRMLFACVLSLAVV